MPLASPLRVNGSNDTPADLWFVAALPPPLNGQSNCNRAMLETLTSHDGVAQDRAGRDGAIRLYDIGGTATTKLRALGRAILAIAFGARQTDRAYLSVPGQSGVWLFVPLALILRWRGITHHIHHHSFRPINLGPLRGMRTLVAAGGDRQRHILLSTDMKRRFADLYLNGDATGMRAASLSNAYLFRPRLGAPPRTGRPITLGHMSVLTREKGVAYLLDMFAILAARGRDWRLVIAGPCADPALRGRIDAAIAAHPGKVDYRGAVDGPEKERFFADIDLFVLPTTLIDEAEPLVMLEAFGRGIDVVANDTGCIRDRIRTPGHLMTGEPNADVGLIEARIAECGEDWDGARQACVMHARAITTQADAEAAALIPRLLPGRRFAIHADAVT